MFGAGRLSGHPVDLLLDPSVDVAASIPDVSSDPEPSRTFPSMPPPVQGVDRHLQVGSQLLCGEQLIEFFHPAIVTRHGFTTVSRSVS